jgi:hypothetical protein
VAKEDWISKSDAMDIGRRLRPELPDEVLRQMLDGAIRPADPQTVRDYCRAHYPFEPPLPMTLYFRPGVERLFSSKSTSQVTMHQSSRPAADVFKTGAPGRPNASHIVVTEAQRRIEKKEVVPKPGGLASFASDLADWWEGERSKYEPPAPPLKRRSIETAIRNIWNEAVAQN